MVCVQVVLFFPVFQGSPWLDSPVATEVQTAARYRPPAVWRHKHLYRVVDAVHVVKRVCGGVLPLRRATFGRDNRRNGTCIAHQRRTRRTCRSQTAATRQQTGQGWPQL